MNILLDKEEQGDFIIERRKEKRSKEQTNSTRKNLSSHGEWRKVEETVLQEETIKKRKLEELELAEPEKCHN